MIAPVSVLLALFLTAGCTFGGVTLISVNPPPPSRPTTLVLGEIQVANPAWTSAPLHFRGRAYDWLTKNPSFDKVLTGAPAVVPRPAARRDGNYTERRAVPTAARRPNEPTTSV